MDFTLSRRYFSPLKTGMTTETRGIYKVLEFYVIEGIPSFSLKCTTPLQHESALPNGQGAFIPDFPFEMSSTGEVLFEADRQLEGSGAIP
jgi:hypothetical protein